MPTSPNPIAEKPDWSRLYDVASQQDGYFTTRQAATAGYSVQLLNKHVQAGRVAQVRRGVHRLVHFPPGEHDELVVAWLWSEREAVVSHQTALALHELSDALPALVHLTVPAAWRVRRLRVPAGVSLHHGDVAKAERAWAGAVPITSVKRTLEDCAATNVSPELLRAAAREAIRRGYVRKAELRAVTRALSQFGGVGT